MPLVLFKAMKKLLVVTAIIFSTFYHGTAQAQYAPEVYKEPYPPFHLLGHIDLNVTRVNNSNSAFSFQTGLIGVYKFSEFVGFHVGAQYNRIAGSVDVNGLATSNSIDFSVNYIDIPVGLTFNYGSRYSNQNFINLGPFFGIPMSKVKFDKNAGEADAQSTWGISLSSHSLWPVGENFGLGIHAFFKYGLKDIINPDENGDEDTKYYTAGIGFSAKFL